MKVLVRLPLSANPERAPFFTDAGGKLCFDGQNYRPMDAASARKIADRLFSDGTPENEAFAAILRNLADESDRLNEAWTRAGKPPAGIGHATQPSQGSA